MKKQERILILMSFLVVFIMSIGVVSAADWTVNPGTSIQSVVNTASTNDTITVNDNNGSAYTYTENVVINKNLTLKSSQNSSVSISSIIINSVGGSTINGFTISGAYDGDGIYLNSARNCNTLETLL